MATATDCSSRWLHSAAEARGRGGIGSALRRIHADRAAHRLSAQRLLDFIFGRDRNTYTGINPRLFQKPVAECNNDESAAADVWTSFEESVTYMRRAAAIYEETFRTASQPSAVVSPRKTVPKARLDEAQQQTHEALELLASNLLNTSADLVNIIEAQGDCAVAMEAQLEEIRDRLRKEQRTKDQLRIAKFYALPENAQSAAAQRSNPPFASPTLVPATAPPKRT